MRNGDWAGFVKTRQLFTKLFFDTFFLLSTFFALFSYDTTLNLKMGKRPSVSDLWAANPLFLPKKRNISPPPFFSSRRKTQRNPSPFFLGGGNGWKLRKKWGSEKEGEIWMDGSDAKTCVISRAERKWRLGWICLSVSGSARVIKFCNNWEEEEGFCRCKIRQGMLLHFCLLVLGHHVYFSEHKIIICA